ncbi:MAG: hypothetical protein IIA60_14655 [Candidatus Marinimicrobia bacterium]|nr:hypothetical protein [Candidatus Neomarinimicrobiota bacterium]
MFWPATAPEQHQFHATVSFDSADDDDGDEIADIWGIPHWVAYEIKKFSGTLPKGPKRPSPWLTDKTLHKLKIAPGDKSYHFSNVWRIVFGSEVMLHVARSAELPYPQKK